MQVRIATACKSDSRDIGSEFAGKSAGDAMWVGALITYARNYARGVVPGASASQDRASQEQGIRVTLTTDSCGRYALSETVTACNRRWLKYRIEMPGAGRSQDVLRRAARAQVDSTKCRVVAVLVLLDGVLESRATPVTLHGQGKSAGPGGTRQRQQAQGERGSRHGESGWLRSPSPWQKTTLPDHRSRDARTVLESAKRAR